MSFLSKIIILPALLVIRAYQILLSPLLGNNCRFHPSCSNYSLTALKRFGLIRGGWLSLRRIIRCHPLNPGGIDDVPQSITDTKRPSESDSHHQHCSHSSN